MVMRSLLMKLSFVALFMAPVLATAQPPMGPDALDLLLGNWSGELMYVDYSSGVETHIPATLSAEKVGKRAWRMTFGYSDEPGSNEIDTVMLSADGHVFDGMEVIGSDTLADGALRITLEQDGEDDNAPARIRKVWTIGPDRCTLRKEVRPMNGGEFQLRHEYRFTR